jgi:HD-GYP domain-containing protein (c-di-GMP phosphodiesterase class II)
MASRITLVCDAYHAMTSDRPYRRALAPEAAWAEVEAGLGIQFCPIAGRALLETLA